MKVLVLGSGVIGVATAWYLRERGCEVTVVDRQPAAAMETSFANAGEISPGYASPWAAPGVPMKALKWLSDPYGPLRFYPTMDLAQWRWMFMMLQNCSPTRYAVNKERMIRLANYARECFIEMRRDTGIQYDDRQLGTLQLFRDAKGFAGIDKDTAVLKDLDVPFEIYEGTSFTKVEPGLAATAHKFVGGIRLPMDETGDCHLFTQKLVAMAAERGVVFRYNTPIEAIHTDRYGISRITTPESDLKADAYVVAMGSFSPRLTRTIGIDFPVYPVKGYSLTAAITDESKAPTSTIMDDAYKVALTRLGNRLRVAGTAEVGGFNSILREGRLETIRHCATDLFAGGFDASSIQYWTGMRPMTPDGTPIVGRTKVKNLFLNTGHGTLGWTMSLGSGRVVADLITDRDPDIALDGLEVSRYR